MSEWLRLLRQNIHRVNDTGEVKSLQAENPVSFANAVMRVLLSQSLRDSQRKAGRAVTLWGLPVVECKEMPPGVIAILSADGRRIEIVYETRKGAADGLE